MAYRLFAACWLDRILRELVILRVAVLNRASSEFEAHVPLFTPIG